MNTLLFGTAGIPLSTQPRNTAEGVRQVRKMGLGAMELEFVRSVNISQKKAPEVRAAARKAGVTLTAHAPYFINLNATDPAKKKASIERILNSARALTACGGWSVCFHAGYYMGMSSKAATENVLEALRAITDTMKEEGLDVWIRPEIGGKTTSWGSLEEILKVSQEFECVQPCIDWAHIYARSLGKMNTRKEFSAVLEQIERSLGKEALTNMHSHVEGIAIGKTGERNHENIGSSLNYQELMKAFRDFRVRGVVICESPNIEQDALLIKKAYEMS